MSQEVTEDLSRGHLGQREDGVLDAQRNSNSKRTPKYSVASVQVGSISRSRSSTNTCSKEHASGAKEARAAYARHWIVPAMLNEFLKHSLAGPILQ